MIETDAIQSYYTAYYTLDRGMRNHEQ
jgi:hypothetical protein